jgi:hypothetical protein
VVKLEAIIQRKQAEEPVWWHTKSLLIERHKGYHISFQRCGERRILQHMASLELGHRHKPMLHEFLQMAGVTVEGVQSYSAVALGEREGNTFEILVFFPIFLLFLPLPFPPRFSFLSPREGGRDRIVDGEKGYRGAQG